MGDKLMPNSKQFIVGGGGGMENTNGRLLRMKAIGPAADATGTHY